MDSAAFEYRWLAGDAEIAEATSSSYVLTGADVGKVFRVTVTFTDDNGNRETLTSQPTAAVAPTVPTEPLGLTVTRGDQTHELDVSWQAPSSDGGSAVSGYRVQWKQAADSWDTPADVSEETVTGTSYTISGLTDGEEYTVRVIAVNGAGDGPASAEATATPVGGTSQQQDAEPENNAPTGLPTISVTARVGETLTADTSGISDADGLTNVSYSYQWIRWDGNEDSDIAEAIGPTYELRDDDQGKTIKVRVTFADDAGNRESLTSEPTAAVAARPNRPATGAPTISGAAQVERTLTADTTGIKDADGLTNASYNYQWLRNDGTSDADIGGATGATYTLVDADERKTIKVRVSFTDDRGHQETLMSAATGAVAAAPSPLTASIHSAPPSHDGSDAITFELRFSEEPNADFSYTTLRDHAFTVTGGEVVGARRLDPPSNVGWEISVSPDGDGGVTVVLPVTEDCEAQGAICTGDGRRLSNRTELTVSGPGQ